MRICFFFLSSHKLSLFPTENTRVTLRWYANYHLMGKKKNLCGWKWHFNHSLNHAKSTTVSWFALSGPLGTNVHRCLLPLNQINGPTGFQKSSCDGHILPWRIRVRDNRIGKSIHECLLFSSFVVVIDWTIVST